MPFSIQRFVAGGLAGFAATVPMTAFMEWADQRRVESPLTSLPPRYVTEDALSVSGVDERNEKVTQLATLVAHYGFGTAMGGLFGLLTERPTISDGVTFGAAVWATSYWLGSLRWGAGRRGGRQTLRQNATMIAAHVVWGANLVLAYESIVGPTTATSPGSIHQT